MSHATGKYLGGVRCIETLRQRCRIHEHTECWRWGLSCDDGRPKVWFVAPDTGKRTRMHGRRAALYLENGHDIPKGHSATPTPDCRFADCVNPAHARHADRVQHGLWLRESGRVKGLPSKKAASLKQWDGRRKITPEMVLEIRESSLSNQKLADKFGVSPFAVYSVRSGQTHKEVKVINGASVFAWRPAA